MLMGTGLPQDTRQHTAVASKADLQSRLESTFASIAKNAGLQHSAANAELSQLLRTLQILLSQVQHTSELSLDIGSTVIHLCTIWSHEPAASIGSPVRQSSLARKYQPPHLRRDRSNASDLSMRSDSESEVSDSGTTQRSAGSHSFAARLAAVQCMQEVARVAGRALHPYWVPLLDGHSSNIDHYNFPQSGQLKGASLVQLMLQDPDAKVRAAAATAIAIMLQGPAQKAYLAIAEYKPSTARQPARAFTTLSTSLGRMAVSLHQALFQGLKKEQGSVLLIALLRALSTLLSAAPYPRLPEELVPSALQVTLRCLLEATPPRDATPKAEYVAASALACLAAALAVTPGPEQLSALLSASSVPPLDAHAHGRAHEPAEAFHAAVDGPAGNAAPQLKRLPEHLLHLATAGPFLVRTEALQALRAMVQSYPGSMQHSAVQRVLGMAGACVSTLTARSVAKAVSGGSQEERCAQQAVLLLADMVASLPAHDLTLHTDPHANAEGHQEEQNRQSERAAALLWEMSVVDAYEPACRCTSSLVRGAACTALSLLDPPTFARMQQQHRKAIWELLCRCCSGATEQAAPVRAAAVKAVGVLAAGTCLLEQEGAGAVCKIIGAAAADSQMSVRIAASWSLGNLASALRTGFHSAGGGGGPTQLQQEYQACACQLAAVALAVPGGSDNKLRANTVRALGNILAMVDCSTEGLTHQQPAVRSQQHADHPPQHEATSPQHPVSQQSISGASQAAANHWQVPAGQHSWLAGAFESLHAGLRTGNGKVQWNACYAVEGLLQNRGAADAALHMGWLAKVVEALLALVRDQGNYKIRTHAAAAMACIPSASHCAGLLATCLAAAADALSGTQGGSQHSQTPPVPGEGARQGDTGRLDLKYLPLLQAQLHATLLHLLSLAAEGPVDGATCTAVLSHHDCILEAAQNGAQQAGLVEPAAYGSAAACWPPRLAAGPPATAGHQGGSAGAQLAAASVMGQSVLQGAVAGLQQVYLQSGKRVPDLVSQLQSGFRSDG